MPRQIDAFPRNLAVNHNPTNQIGVTAAQIKHLQDEVPAALVAAEKMFVNSVLEAIDAATGLDLVDWVAETQDALNGISAAFQQSWLSFQNLLNGLAQQADADVAAALTWLSQQFNQLNAALQQSWLSFQNLLNGIVQETDADVAAAVAWLQGVGTAANNALTQIEDFLTTGDWSDLTVAYNDLVQAIFGTSTSLGLVGAIPAPAVVDVVQNLQPVWDFPDADSVSAGGQWLWDGTVDHTGVSGSGSAKVVANGTLQGLRGTPGAVQPAQVVTASAWVSWSGLTASGSPIQLELIPSSNSGSTLTAGAPVTVASITSPGASGGWTELSGTYTVPSSGVDAVQLRLVVTAAATAGSVWWDDCQADVSGGFLADLKSDTNNIIGSFAPGGTAGEFVTGVQNLLALFGLSSTSVGTATDLTALWTTIVNDFINPLNAIEISAVNGLATSLSALLGTTTFQTLLDSVANALGHSGTGHTITNIETYLGLIPPANVTNVLGGANLGADVSAVHSTATTNTTSIASQQAWWNSLATDLWIYADLFHAYYPVGSPSDTATTTSGGRRTWYSAIADMKVLFATIGSSPPVISTTDVGGAVTTAQSTATTASTTATSAQSTATTANTMFGLSQQAGTNLVLAPGFESTTAWTSASAGAQSAVQAHSGTNSWLLQGTGTGNTTTLRLINSSAGPTVLKSRAGEVFQMQAFIYPKTGNAGGGTVAVQIVCTDSTGVNAATTIVAATETVPATGSWSSLSGTASVPTGYDTVDPQLILLSVPTTDFVYVDDVLVRETTLVTTAQNTADDASSDAGSALNQLTAIPSQNVVPLSADTGQPAALVASGAGATGTGVGTLTISWADTIPPTADYVVVVANSATTHGASAIARMDAGGAVKYLTVVGTVSYSSSGKLIVFGVANPPAGAVNFTVDFRDGTSLFSMASATSMAFSNILSLSALVSNSANNANPALSTAFNSSQLVVNAIGTFGTAGSNVGLSAYNRTSRYHPGNFNGGSQFNMDLIAGTVSGVSNPNFTATVASTTNEGYAAIALVVNPPPSILGSYARAFRSPTSGTSISTAAHGAGKFGSVFDTFTASDDIAVDLSTGRMTVSYSGTYLFKVGIAFTGIFTTQTMEGSCFVNGQLFERTNQQWYASSNQTGFTWFTPVFLNAGQYVEPGWQFGSGTLVSAVGDSTGSKTYMTLSLLNRSLL